MPRELLQARFDPDTVETVEQFAQDKDISRSEALRRLVRAGARSKGLTDDTDTDTDDGLLSRLFG